MGRKPIGAKPAELIAMRLNEELLVRIDAYAERHGPGRIKALGRAEAIRELLERSLRLDERAEKRRKAAALRKPVRGK